MQRKILQIDEEEWGIKNIPDIYTSFFNSLTSSELNQFLTTINNLTTLGAEGFAYRVIDSKGISSLFSNSRNWYNVCCKEGFADLLKQHINEEMRYVFKNKSNSIRAITTIGVSSVYPRLINEYGLNENISKYKFNKDNIEIFYLIYDKKSPYAKSSILRYLERIESHIDKMSEALSRLREWYLFKMDRKEILEKKLLNKIWKRDVLKTNLRVIHDDRLIYLTPREYQCLELMSFKDLLGRVKTMIDIGEELSISQFTARDCINRIKEKFGAYPLLML